MPTVAVCEFSGPPGYVNSIGGASKYGRTSEEAWRSQHLDACAEQFGAAATMVSISSDAENELARHACAPRPHTPLLRPIRKVRRVLDSPADGCVCVWWMSVGHRRQARLLHRADRAAEHRDL